jgi:hypothetical protein
MAAIFDALAMLIPAGLVSSSQDFPVLELHPRQLPTCTWIVSMLIPPVGATTFRLQVAQTQAGSYSTIETFVWTAGLSGTKQVPIAAGGNLASILNNQSTWIRVSVTTAGAFTLAGSWLTKNADGGPGRGSRSYALDNINAI